MTATLLLLAVTLGAEPPPGFRLSAPGDEFVREEWLADGVRVLARTGIDYDANRPTRLIIYATPNGSTVDHANGWIPNGDYGWPYDNQHIAAQVRMLRTLSKDTNVVLAILQAHERSWPAWKKKQMDGPARIRAMLSTVCGWLPPSKLTVSLTGHSGGGSFLLGFIDSTDAIEDLPEAKIESIIFLDAVYSFEDRHADRVLAWLKADRSRTFLSLAYDDRNITLNGKPVIGPDGGTFRATGRMRVRFGQHEKFQSSTMDVWRTETALDGRLRLLVHPNPENKILHTAMVGDMNGLLFGLAPDQPLTAPRRYEKFIHAAPAIPAHPRNAEAGLEVISQLAKRSAKDREERIVAEILKGNFPEHLRQFRKVTIKADSHVIELQVMPDYLMLGSDADGVRIPMTPQSASRIADAFGCALPTKVMVDAIHQAATVKLEPIPMTKDREAVETFLQHHQLIEEKRKPNSLGELVSGIKKDVVVSNRLAERPRRLAIYGWHQSNGEPIQKLTIVHHQGYVDYSHGIRLIKRLALVDGKPVDLRDLVSFHDLHRMVSDEGRLLRVTY